MISIKTKTFLNLLEDYIVKLENNNLFDCIILLDFNKKGSYCNNTCYTSSIIIGCSYLNNKDFIPLNIAVDIIINIFHEYQHALRNYEMYHSFQKGCKEIYVSSFTSAYFPYYYHLKHRMSPNELDAELNGILNAKLFFEEFYPEFDFENAVVERVNELFQDNCWYGPYDDSELKVVFSYNEIIDYLETWQTFAYNYNPLLDIKDKTFCKTKECSLLDTKENGAKHYNNMLKYIKEFKTLSYEDEILIDKLLHFSKEKTKSLEDAKDERSVYDDWSTR